MKEYRIKSNHYVNTWSNKEGEGKAVNYYTLDNIIEADNAHEAIKQYIEDVLCFTYKKETLEYGLNSPNEVQFSNIVDVDNYEDEKGKYISSNFIYIEELTKVAFL